MNYLWKNRTVVEAKEVKKEVDKFQINDALFGDFWLSLTWTLHFNPEIGQKVSTEPERWIYKQAGYTELPSILVFYYFTDIEIHITNIRIGD